MKASMLLLLCGLAFAMPADAQTSAPTSAAGIPAVVYQTSNVRAAPDTRAPIVGRLAAGESVTAIGRTGDLRWIRIEAAALEGWLPVFSLALAGDPGDLPPLDATAVPSVVGTASPVRIAAVGRVNVRREPLIADNVVGQLDANEQAQAVARSSQENDWLLIQNDEIEGWVAYFTVRVQGDPAVLPVLVPDGAESLVPPSLQVTALFNIRLRAEAALDAAVIVVVPFGERVTLLGRSASAEWVLVRFVEQEGWVASALVDAPAEQIAALPLIAPEMPAEASREP